MFAFFAEAFYYVGTVGLVLFVIWFAYKFIQGDDTPAGVKLLVVASLTASVMGLMRDMLNG